MAQVFTRFKFRPGWIEVISGCMFSGKTEELIRQLRRAELAKQKYQVFKPNIDTRYSIDNVASHNKSTIPSLPVKSSLEILDRVEKRTLVVGIDEAQFFDSNIIDVVTQLADEGKRVLVAGLDLDWQGQPFGPMPQLLAIAEVIHKQYAICMVCGEHATRTQRLIPNHENILVGSNDMYEARCRVHFDPQLSTRLPKSKPTIVNSETTEPDLSI